MDDDVKERYRNLILHLYQYVTNPIKDFVSIKPQILEILKTHRPIKTDDYQYGISKSGKKKGEIIVHECEDDRTIVREYFKDGKNVWHCCECDRISTVTQELNDLIIVRGIVFVKLKQECEPRELSFVMDIQELYENGQRDVAAALQKSVLGPEKMASIETPAIMSKFLDENGQRLPPEALFAELTENLQEYTNENAEAVLSNKSLILRTFETFNQVKSVNHLFGMSRNLKKDQSLIVFEWNDRRRVREYSKRKSRKTLWECRECCRMYDRGTTISYSYLHLINGIVFIHKQHNSRCKPLDYQRVMQYQKYLEKGDTVNARRFARTIGFDFDECSNVNVVNTLDDVTCPSLTRNGNFERTNINDKKNNSKTSTNFKRKLCRDNNGDTSLNDESSILKKPKLSKEADKVMVLGETSTCSKKSKHKKVTSDDVYMDDTNMNEVDCDKQEKKSKHKKNKENQADVEDHTVNKMEEEESATPGPTTSVFAFEKPSAKMVKKICDKLNIQYRKKAMKLWDLIVFDQIDTDAPPNIKTHEFQTENFYEILSKLFTGKSKHHQQIKETILKAFRTKVVESGEMSARKFNKRYWNDTVTDRHLSFIAKFFRCRILIYDFDENEMRMYGKWKETSRKRATVVLSFSDGLYSIVLKL